MPLAPVRLAARRRGRARAPTARSMLRSPQPLPPIRQDLIERLEHWAEQRPTARSWRSATPTGGWRTLTYAQALDSAQAASARALLRARPVGASGRSLILSGNDIEHALLALAAMHVGIPYAPVSPAYSLISSDFGKLRAHPRPADAGPRVRRRRRGLRRARSPRRCRPTSSWSSTRNPPAEPARRRLFADLLGAPMPTGGRRRAARASGPTPSPNSCSPRARPARPRRVINTQRMLCANQEMLREALAFFNDEPPVLVDWLPWNHTFGGNHDFGLVLYNGGTLYIDDGKPTPAGSPRRCATCARSRRPSTSTCPRASRSCCRICSADADAAQDASSAGSRCSVLRRRRPDAADLGRDRRLADRRRPASASCSDRRSARPRPRRCAIVARRGIERAGNRRPAAPRRRAEARAERRQAGGAACAARTSRPAIGGSPN